MPGRSPLRSPVLWVIVAGAVAGCFVPSLLLPIVMPWRRPVQDWMVGHGLARFAGQYALFNIHIPDFLCSFIGGAVVGLLLHQRWAFYSILFSATYLMLPQVIWVGMVGPGIVRRVGPIAAWLMLAWNVFATFPFALTGAWTGAKRGCRRYVQWKAGLICLKCGYNLFGNVSGRCPECNELIPMIGLQTQP
jgi:hypothetical protein